MILSKCVCNMLDLVMRLLLPECIFKAGLDQEIDDLKKKLTSCIRENANLQEELSEAYRIKNQLADLHAAELSKSVDAEKQIKFFQSSVAAAFSERDTAIMEAEQAKEKEEIASQKFDIMQQKIEELTTAVLEEKKLSTTLQTDLSKQQMENEIFKQVINKFYDIRQNSLNRYDDASWGDKCTSLLNDSEDMWTFTGSGETSTTKYITKLEVEVEALRKSVINLQSKLQMGLEIEKHLKKLVHDLKNKKISMKERMKRDILGLRGFHSQYRLEVVNLLEEESCLLKSAIDDIKENLKKFSINEEHSHSSPQRDMTLQENDCRDVHISPDTGLDTITKEEAFGIPSTSISGAGDESEALVQMIKDKESISDLQKACSAETGDVPEPLAQALQEKVAALLLLSQEEERYLLESNINAALQNKLEELQRNLIQVTNEKVIALMELAQLKQEYHLLQEKINDDVHHGKVATVSDEKSVFHDKDGRLKGLLRKAYFSQWISPHQQNAQNISSTSTMDFARMKIEYSALKESLESMEHLTSSIRRLRLSLVKVKDSIPAEEDTAGKKSEIIENVVTEAKLLKTALGSSLPVSWSAEADNGVSSAEKVDCVSAAGFEMVELLILASHLVRNSML
uniref:paramyosin isoform X2 n=1 Tax=Erigeron canadensis TaxID=72917 RepID=UPI001CB951AE|nr:paramyosin isoform X2 [Erigeron canadensis]